MSTKQAFVGPDPRDLASRHTVEAIGTLVSVIRNRGAKPSDRIAAARELLDRGHGKSAQEIRHTGATGGAARLNSMTTAQLEAALQARLKAEKPAIEHVPRETTPVVVYESATDPFAELVSDEDTDPFA